MRRAVGLLGLAVTLLALPGCSNSKPAASSATTSGTVAPTTTTQPEPTGLSAFNVAPAEVHAWNAPPEFPDSARAGVQTLLDRYLADAVLRPLRSGEPAGDLAAVFGPPAGDRMTGPDRVALVDEGLPKAESARVEVASADIVALTGLTVVSAGIHLLIAAKIGGTPLRIERTGELQLSVQGDAWKVIGYDVRVARDTPDAAVTTTVASHP
ncbi:MAG: hypothetical protein LC792_26490 [Actinobacteria bacterium]|nr:hypothetical protein [Actinomycetota bacterium]